MLTHHKIAFGKLQRPIWCTNAKVESTTSPTTSPTARPTNVPTKAPTRVPTTAPTPYTCPGFDRAMTFSNGHLYGVVAQQKTWPDADAYAKTLTCCGVQGHLVTVASYTERGAMESAMSAYSGIVIWFGMVSKGGIWVYAGTETPADISFYGGRYVQGYGDGTGASYRSGTYYVTTGTDSNYFAVEFDCA